MTDDNPARWNAVHAQQAAAARRQLREVRGMAALTVLLGLVTVALGVVVLNRLAAPPQHSAGLAVLTAPRRVQLQIVGGSPAAEVIGHIAYQDGTEAEYAPGAYDVTGLAGASIGFTAGPGETLCRIVVDNVLVAEEFAYSGGQAQCRWSAR